MNLWKKNLVRFDQHLTCCVLHWKEKGHFSTDYNLLLRTLSLDFPKQKLNFNESLQPTDHMCGTNL